MLNWSLCRQAGSFFRLYGHNGHQRYRGSLTLSGNIEETMAESVALSSLSGVTRENLRQKERKKDLYIHVFSPPSVLPVNYSFNSNFVHISKMLRLQKLISDYCLSS